MLNLGLIGFGRFGQFAAKHLRSRLHLFVWDIRDQRKRAASLGVTWGTLEEVASCQVVVIAVPATEIPAVLAQCVRYLRPGALLMDVASVKTLPVQWMLAAAPPEVEVIGTHPLFGPESGRGGIEGLTVILCPARTSRTEQVVRFLEAVGVRTSLSGPEDHDRMMAMSQAITHFVARGLDQAGVKDVPMGTPSFQRLLQVVRDVREDSPESFRAMQSLNPWAAETRERLMEALRLIQKQIDEE